MAGWAGWCVACWLAHGWLLAAGWEDDEEEGCQGILTRWTLWRGRRISAICLFIFDLFWASGFIRAGSCPVAIWSVQHVACYRAAAQYPQLLRPTFAHDPPRNAISLRSHRQCDSVCIGKTLETYCYVSVICTNNPRKIQNNVHLIFMNLQDLKFER